MKSTPNRFLLPCLISTLLAAAGAAGCWTEITHVYDCNSNSTEDAESDADADDDNDAGMDPKTDGGATGEEPRGQGDRPPGWEGMGAPCATHEDCTDIAPGGRCIFNIVEMINAPGGYCLGCCNKPGVDMCAPGIDCVGVDEVYLICLNHCSSNDQCRTDEGYECRPIWYLDTIFEGNYCLPDADHVAPDDGAPMTEPECDWPWL